MGADGLWEDDMYVSFESLTDAYRHMGNRVSGTGKEGIGSKV